MSELKKLEVVNFIKGANSDDNITQVPKGNYLDAHNIRLADDGDTNVAKRINGEEVKYDLGAVLTTYDNTINQLNYECVASIVCKNQIVSFFASSILGEKSFIFIDDNLVCATEKLVLWTDRNGSVGRIPLQIDKNESCTSGEVFITNETITPLYFVLNDMLDNINTEKYFTEFNIDLYKINLKTQVDAPVFDSLVFKGLGGGKKVGTYYYSIRYVDAEGNRTSFSPSTDLIPVVMNVDTKSTIYPNSATYGAVEGTLSPYAIKIKFRVNNKSNYSFIEVRRIYWDSALPLGITPNAEVYTIPTALENGQIDVWEFIDDADKIWTTLTTEEATAVYSSIETAKTLRYFDNRLVLMNIEYRSRDLIDDKAIVFEQSAEAEIGYSFLKHIGKDGHANVKKASKYKSYPSGEKFGFGVLVYDNGQPSFISPIETENVQSLKDFQYPNRRTELKDGGLELSLKQNLILPTASNTKNSISYVHEVFDLQKATVKVDDPSIVTISEKGDLRYNPLTPKDYKRDNTLHDYRTLSRATIKIVNGGKDEEKPYLPIGFAPDYYAHGIAIQGLSNLPDTTSGFSIVRTKRANRILAQGIATYSMTTKDDDATKVLNKIWFYSDDVNGLGLDITQTGLKLQFVSPLGFFTEVYANEYKELDKHTGLDMITYARIQKETGSINIGLKNIANLEEYYTKFGSWRGYDNLRQNPFMIDGSIDGDKLFEISNISTINSISTNFVHPPRNISGLTKVYEIELSSETGDIYLSDGFYALNDNDANSNPVCAFHEPYYIVNIIQEGAEVGDNNINDYIETGHYQKIESIIGVSNGGIKSFELIDERFDDCCPSEYDSNKANVDTFLYIKEPLTGIEQAWLNVEYKSTNTINTIIQDIIDNGYYEAVLEDLSVVKVYGVYSHTFDSDTEDYVINFNKTINGHRFRQDDKYFYPLNTFEIIVKYDKRFPLKVFGGDTFIGESIACLIDGSNDKDGNYLKDGDNKSQFGLSLPFPYPRMTFNDNYKIISNARTETNRYQESPSIDFNYVRQMLVMFTSESRVNLPFAYNELSEYGTTGYDGVLSFNQSFPRIHYVQRPQDWDADNPSENFGLIGITNTPKIDEQYLRDFPMEFESWFYGGFKFANLTNICYSQEPIYKKYQSRPVVGFTEQNKFCTGIIWSLKREINVQNDPSLKTFPALNFFAISDAQGAIKYAYDTETSKGENLYAFTDSGICLLLTTRDVADATGNNIGYLSVDVFIQKEYWIEKEFGVSDEMWRGIAEYDKLIIFPNKNSVYAMIDNKITDIGRNGYHKRIKELIIDYIQSGYTNPLNATIDKHHREYWLSILQNYFNLYWTKNEPFALGVDTEITYVNDIAISIEQYPSSTSVFFTHNRTAENLTVEFYMQTVNELGVGNFTINWGDGISEEIEILTSVGNGTILTHNYSEAGDYSVDLIGTDFNKLQVINLSTDYNNNRLTNLYLSKEMINLFVINAKNNILQSVRFYPELVKLAEINLKNNSLTNIELFPEMIKLNSLYLTDNNLTSIELFKEYTLLKVIQLKNNSLTTIELFKEMVNLEVIWITNNNLISIELFKEMTKLYWIDLADNNLTSIQLFVEFTKLQYLELQHNNIPSIELFKEMVELETLTLQYNELISLELFPEMTKLKVLNASHNQLDEIILFVEMINLEILGFSENNLTAITLFPEMINLIVIDFAGNDIVESDINSILIIEDAKNLIHRNIYLQGGTNSVPTGLGLTAKANLISRSYTVKTN